MMKVNGAKNMVSSKHTDSEKNYGKIDKPRRVKTERVRKVSRPVIYPEENNNNRINEEEEVVSNTIEEEVVSNTEAANN
ncbi:hypothetical protein C5167_035463 [Papaver somniferum]|uniref:Uncharacterized protein n=1 Tax=Papaver somniferum TaxID=3469 RepID=A0A4Y7KG12_PAPSO|nr:hypothetical protein C5167_035463 [Papaver somniferum]